MGKQMTMGDEYHDHYSAAIELSNSCRRFYFNHRKTTEEFKKNVNLSRRCGNGKPNGTVKSRLDAAMDKLRTEMAELMDQDLSLMEQLLTLNDKIEEMKHRYMYSVSKDSLGTSSCNLSTYYTDSEMSLASLDINDYNEDHFLGSDTDVSEKGAEDKVLVARQVGIDDAFKRWVKKQRELSDEDSDSDKKTSEGNLRPLTDDRNTMNKFKDEEKLLDGQSKSFIASEKDELDSCTSKYERKSENNSSATSELLKKPYVENSSDKTKDSSSINLSSLPKIVVSNFECPSATFPQFQLNEQ